LTVQILNRGVSPPHGDALFSAEKCAKRLLLAEGMALSTGRRLRSSPLPGRTPAPPSPPWAGPIHLGPRGFLHAIRQHFGAPIFSIRNALGFVRKLPTPRAGAAGGGWMNVDQPDKLSEGRSPA
jgi:hypothetical protein